jgi:hypothetical protein
MPRLVSLCVVLILTVAARAQTLDFEKQPANPAAAKIVLIAGPASAKAGEHEYVAGCYVLSKLLEQTPGVAPVIVKDGWPTKKETLDGARTLVFFRDGGDSHCLLKDDRMAQMQKLVDAGVGVVFFHQCIDFPKDPGQRAIQWMGGVWEKGFGQRAHWVAEFDTFPSHSVTRGVTPFKIDDGWLYKDRFLPGLKGVTPLLRTASPKAAAGTREKDEAIVSWLYDRPDGGRSFTFTGCHLHSSWGIENYRRLLTNGILWTAKIEVPTGGAPVALDEAELKKYLDERTAKKK